MRQRYVVVIERAPGNFSAYAPDVPGCITTGTTIEATLANMVEALTGHLAVTHAYGEQPPEPTTTIREVTPLALDDLVTTVEVELPEGAHLAANALA